jgi:hypothetical protein
VLPPFYCYAECCFAECNFDEIILLNGLHACVTLEQHTLRNINNRM